MSRLPKKKESKEKTDSAAKLNLGNKSELNTSHEEDAKDRTKFQRGIPKLPVSLWPEWNDTEVQQEKWDSGHKSKIEKGKSPNTSQHCFEDLDGRLELPRSIADKVTNWVKPAEWIQSESGNPVVVKCDATCDNPSILLKHTSMAARQSELVNAIVLSIPLIWHYHKINAERKDSPPSEMISSPKQEKDEKKGAKHERSKTTESQSFSSLSSVNWMPWYHIWPKENAKSLMPTYNSSGKFCIKLFWMGCWRKVTVDDAIPIDSNGDCLLPTTAEKNELWPLLIAKGIIKLASLEYGASCSQSEFGEFSIVHSLTGWYPQAINIKCLKNEALWTILHGHLPKWDVNSKIPQDIQAGDGCVEEANDERHINQCKNWLMIAANSCNSCSPESISAIGKHTEAAMALRQHGFQMGGTHMLKLDCTRDSPLKMDNKDEKIKRWKLIRQKRSRSAQSNNGPPSFEECHWVMGTSAEWSLEKFKRETESEAQFDRKINALSIVNETEQHTDTRENKEQQEKESTNGNEDSSEQSNENNSKEESIHDTTQQNTETNLGDAEDCQDQTVSEWMTLKALRKLFNTIWVFHDPEKLTHRKLIPDQKDTKQTNTVEASKQEKNKKNASNHGNHASSAISASLTAATTNLFSSQIPAHVASVYVFVDSLEESKLIMCLSSLTRWHDNKDTIDEYVTSVEDGLSFDPLYTKPIKTALAIEKHKWHDPKLQLPFYEMKTTSAACGTITLPKGRHILKCSINYNHGYNIELCSNTPFTVGDEDTIADNATQESFLYNDYVTKTIKSLLQVIKSMSKGNTVSPMQKITLIKEYTNDFAMNSAIQQKLLELIFMAIKSELKTCLPDEKQSLLHLSLMTWKFQCQLTSVAFDSLISLGKDKSTYNIDAENSNSDHEFINEIRYIQAISKGWLTRKVIQSSQIGSPINDTVTKYLNEIASTIEADLQSFASAVLKSALTMQPDMIKHLPFAGDEAYKLCYSDYNGNHPEFPANTSFVFVREVVTSQDDNCGEGLSVQLVAPSIPWYRLIVVDNDTGMEVQENAKASLVTVRIDKCNKNGYTIVGESRSTSTPIPSGKTRLRLIGVRQSLPKQEKKKPNTVATGTQLFSKETIGYYTPNQDHHILRYCISVTADQYLTFQLTTSDANVIMKVEVIDGSNVLLSKTGKGNITLASLLFEADTSSSGTSTRATSRTGSRQNSGKSIPKQSRAALKSVSERQTPKSVSSTSVSSDRSNSDGMQENSNDAIEQVIHSYIIQATILNNSWPLTVAEWASVLKNSSSETNIDGSPELMKEKERHSAGHRKKTTKDNKESRSPSKVQQVPSRLETMSFDWKRPHWILNITYDNTQAEPMVKRDCQRENEIIALKAAWEAASPGRAEKAATKRESILTQLVLESNQSKINTSEELEQLVKDPFKKSPIMPIELNEEKLKRTIRQTAGMSAKERIEIYCMKRDAVEENRKQNTALNDAIKAKQQKDCQYLYSKMLEDVALQQKKRTEYATKGLTEDSIDLKESPSKNDGKKSPSKTKSSPLHNQQSASRQATKSPTKKKTK